MSSQNIVPGCWIQTEYGPAVALSVGEWVMVRYQATRMSDNKLIWVANGVLLSDVSFLRSEDDDSRKILAMKGPYGEGEVFQSDPPYVLKLPNGWTIGFFEYKFTPQSGGSLLDPPDPAEGYISQAFWMTSGVELSPEELEWLHDDEEAYTSLIDYLDEIYQMQWEACHGA